MKINIQLLKTAFIAVITGQYFSYLTQTLKGKDYEVHELIRKRNTFDTGRIDHRIRNKKYDNSFFRYSDLTDPLS